MLALLSVIGMVITLVAMVVIKVTHFSLKNRSKELSEKISTIALCEEEQKRNGKQDKNNPKNIFTDIESGLRFTFDGQVISSSDKKGIASRYADIYREAYSLLRKSKFFGVVPPEVIAKFVCDYENIPTIVKRHNEKVLQDKLIAYKEFFDHCLNYPLDKQQRRSIVSEEENCLVISSAGSGKTSSIVGKVKYLIEIKRVAPQNILLISYTNKAAAELTERMNIPGLRGYTFHKLTIDIIGLATGKKPSICDSTDSLFVKIYHDSLADEEFKKNVLGYFIDYQTSEENPSEQQKYKIRQQLSELKETRLKAQFPDMDGRIVYVRSEQERKICFVLFSLGVNFRYEEPYEHPLVDEMHSQYKPDFSIYYEQKGEIKRIYLEHFGVDDHSLVPIWFAKEKGLTYEEANKKYNDGITWKKTVHEKFGTKLITTSSADFHYSDIKEKLKALLKDFGVPIHEKTETELYDALLPQNSKQEKAFIRLVVTFITLIKSSCKSVSEVIQQVNNENDERSAFIITNIFQPVYKKYIEELQNRGQIDFTDAILQATDICRSTHPVQYEYIIVDEFQDISVDRYNFLKALREDKQGHSSAKLYCVGDDWQSIYRFSGSDMSLFSQFSDYFGETEINKIETTYRFGEPLVSLSSQFIQRNKAQIKKDIHPFNTQIKTDLLFCAYGRGDYCMILEQLISSIPLNNSVFLLGRYSFDDYYLSFAYKSVKEGNRFFYIIGGRKIEFLTVHKSKGLEADYVIILQCNKDTYGFPSLISDDPVLNYVLTESDQYPYGEERRLFYVAITRAKIKTWVLYDKRFSSVFVEEFLHPEKVTEGSYTKHRNANKLWTMKADKYLMTLYHEGRSVKYIAEKMGRSQTAIVMRLGKLKEDGRLM